MVKRFQTLAISYQNLVKCKKAADSWNLQKFSMNCVVSGKNLPNNGKSCIKRRVCILLPSAGKFLPLNIQKTSLLYQLIPILQFLVNYYWQCRRGGCNFVNINIYFNLHVCLSICRLSFAVCHLSRFEFSISTVESHNISNKSCLVCVKSEKYAL